MNWFIFYKNQLLLQHNNGKLEVPQSLPAFCAGNKTHDVYMCSGEQIKATRIDEPIDTEGWKLVDLRQSYHYLSEADYLSAGKAFQILWWDSHSQYCPVCGTPTLQQTPIMKQCPKCKLEMYPPIATAVIVLIRRGDEILLVHSRNFRGNYYGLVAGFLEAGEDLEQCVRREVREETGLNIRNLQYFASQPWPYPSGLMVGFTADYESGEIKLQEDELSAAGFYSAANLPQIPEKMSIARKLIDHWLCEQQAK